MTEQAGYEFHDSKGEHLHTLNGKPLIGTSTVLSIVAKPLTWWASGEAVKTLGWTPKTEYVNGKPRSLPKEPRIKAAYEAYVSFQGVPDAEIGETWLTKLDSAYSAHTRALTKAAGKGVDLHAKLEKYVKYCLEKGEGKPIMVKSELIQDFINWSTENVEKFLASEVHTYSEKYWLGGILDTIAVLKTGQHCIIDFKSSREAYPNQFWQIGGYSIQIAENGWFTSKGEKLHDALDITTHIIIPFGAPAFAPAIIHDEKGINVESYKAALTLYKNNSMLNT